jgi:hypothetical protein
MRAVLVTSCLLLGGVCLGQESANFRLEESVLNAGGNPSEGAVLASASFRVTLDSIGEPLLGRALSSASFRVDGGFAPAYPPPREVVGLRFDSRDTLDWSPEPSVGVYNLYRDLLSALDGGGYGDCSQRDLPEAEAIDGGAPPAGDGWFYLATAENRLGEEGTMGKDSAGAERPNLAPCP